MKCSEYTICLDEAEAWNRAPHYVQIDHTDELLFRGFDDQQIDGGIRLHWSGGVVSKITLVARDDFNRSHLISIDVQPPGD